MAAVITVTPVTTAPAPVEASPGDGSLGRLVRFALANVRRRPERFILSTLGIALAVMAVVLVRTIAAGYASTGSVSLDDVLRGERVWVVGPQGFAYEPRLQALLPGGPAPDLAVPEGWTATRTLGGAATISGHDVALYGRDAVPAGTAVFGETAAALLGVRTGDSVTLGVTRLVVAVEGSATSVTVNTAVAQPITGDDGWWTLTPPAALADLENLGPVLTQQTGLPATTDPARTADPADDPSTSKGLIYDTQGGSSLITFKQKFAALFTGQVTGSALGIVSTVGLILGFVIAVSSFLAAVQERRREFGIMSSIGLADEVLYFFLVESALVFLAAYTLGALAAGLAVALVVPGITTLGGWLASAATVGAYLPAMAIVGALIPVHRLVQQRPVDLLRES